MPDTAEGVASAVASAVMSAVASAISSAGGPSGADIVVEASSGARSRDPIVIDDGEEQVPAADDTEVQSTLLSMPSLESVDDDYTEAEVTVLHGNSRE